MSSPSHTSRITRDSSEKVGSRPDAACVTRAKSGRSPGLHLGFSGMMLFPSGATYGQTMEVAWGVGTGQQDRLGYFHPRYHSRDRAGQRGVLTTAPPGLAPFLPPQSPNLAMSAPGNPTLAPAQLCSWPPPAAPVAGPRARAGAADTTTQLKLGPEPEGRAVTEGWGRKGDRNGGVCGYEKGLSLATWTVTTRACASCPRHACVHTRIHKMFSKYT